MQDALLLIMSIIGLFALYWVLFGQWKHNKMMREADIERLKKEIAKKEQTKKKTNKK